MPSENPRLVQSVKHSMRILNTVKNSKGISLSEIAKEVDLAPGTVHSHLSTLMATDYLVKRNNEFVLSPQLITVGERARSQEPLYDAGKIAVQELADESGEAVHLIREYKGRVLPIYEVFGERAIGVDYHIEQRERLVRHLHCTAAGKAVLSQLPKEQIKDVIEQHGLEKKTPNTIDTEDALFEELEKISDQGYAIADEEQMLGIRAIGGPIMRTDGSVEGAISVSGPTSRFKGSYLENDLLELLMKAVNIAEINLNKESSPGM